MPGEKSPYRKGLIKNVLWSSSHKKFYALTDINDIHRQLLHGKKHSRVKLSYGKGID
jgi:hypothetical protein